VYRRWCVWEQLGLKWRTDERIKKKLDNENVDDPYCSPVIVRVKGLAFA
jgi:hypothetical protein